MRNPPVTLTLLLLLLLVGPAARAAPREGGHRPELPTAAILDEYPDPLSPESPVLPLLRSAVKGLGPLQQDVEAMTREQALLYLVVLHDHDRSGRLDGLELLQLLGTVLAQGGGQPDPDTVAALVDRALARRDLNGDGLLDPRELLDTPELLSTNQAGAEESTEMPGGDPGVSDSGQAAPETGATQAKAAEDGDTGGDEAPKVESSSAEAMEAEEAHEAEAPNTDVAEEEEASEAEVSEGEAAPAWRDHGEG